MCQINVSCNLEDEGWAGVTPGVVVEGKKVTV
jgi:hypothetical protein